MRFLEVKVGPRRTQWRTVPHMQTGDQCGIVGHCIADPVVKHLKVLAIKFKSISYYLATSFLICSRTILDLLEIIDIIILCSVKISDI